MPNRGCSPSPSDMMKSRCVLLMEMLAGGRRVRYATSSISRSTIWLVPCVVACNSVGTLVNGYDSRRKMMR